MTVTFKLLLAIAATVLLVIAGVMALGNLSGNALAVGFFGLACLAGAHWIP